MNTDCRVQELYQARCSLCAWSGEVTGVRAPASYDARVHRASDEHKAKLAERAARGERRVDEVPGLAYPRGIVTPHGIMELLPTSWERGRES